LTYDSKFYHISFEESNNSSTERVLVTNISPDILLAD